MLEIITAEEAGFCFGVKRAIDLTIKAVENNKEDPVYILGSLIHNPQVVNNLKDLGVTSIDSIDEISEGVLIIRSHGVEPSIINKAEQKGLHIVNATCPFVKKAQQNAKKLIQENYQTIIFGEKDHPEVAGIYGFTDKKAYIVKEISDLDSIELNDKIGFVAQTTQSPESYRNIISSVISDAAELKIFNTICNTTQVRQHSAAKLAKQVDIMFVIGGYNSANTNRLAEICQNTDTPTYHIETVDDLNWEWLKEKETIGITAGASTPDWLIKEVIDAMNEQEKDIDITKNNEEQENTEVNESEEIVGIEDESQEESKEENNITQETKKEGNDDMNLKKNVEDNDNEVEQNSPKEVETTEDVVENVEEDNEVVDEIETELEEQEVKDSTVDKEEIEEAEMSQEEQYNSMEIADIKKGQMISGEVVEIAEDGVYVDVNYKSEGFIPLHELSQQSFENPEDIVSEGKEIDVIVLTLEDEDGNLILSKKQADYEKAWERIMTIYEDDDVIEAEVTQEVKGGLVVDVGIRGFVPASHVAIGYVEDLSDYVGEKLPLKIIEVERENNNVVLSARKLLEKERKHLKEETFEKLEEGQTVTGKITKLVDFGAFVDLGGVEGLLHISEMSWGRIEHPSDLFEEGEDIEVKILSIDEENERISLGYKQLQPDPWQEFADKHYEGEIIEGTITKLVDFGVFMQLDEGIEGLIHISQLSDEHVETADEVVSVGEKRQAKILNIDPEQKRVGLSLKEVDDQLIQKSGDSKDEQKNQDQKEEGDKKPKKGKKDGATIGELVGDIFDDS